VSWKYCFLFQVAYFSVNTDVMRYSQLQTVLQ
jgi:hypothetical protein